MKIYTKTGDAGKTSVFGGARVAKYDLQVEACGAVDEATSFVGFAGESVTEPEMKSLVKTIQLDLYSIMGYLAGAKLKEKELESNVKMLEKTIDSIDKKLPKLTRFILPQGSEPTVRMHVSRVMVRSAERRVVEYIDSKKQQTAEDVIVLQYMNRLSDLLFMLARNYSPEEILT